MRIRSATPWALAAALAAASPVSGSTALAQPVGAYAISGCVDGVTRFDPSATPAPYVRGRVACFGGTTALSLTPLPGDPYRLYFRAEGTLTAAFDPAFSARFMYLTGAELAVTQPACKPGCYGGSPFLRPQPFGPGGPVVLPFSAIVGSTPPVDLALLEGLYGAVFFEYGLPGDPPGSLYSGRADLTFTAVPEPSTFALGAAGGVALWAGSRGRTRRRGRGRRAGAVPRPPA